MKKLSLLTLFLAVIMAISSCKKEENKGDGVEPGANITVQQKNLALVQKHTGSLCGPCGSWGWAAFDEIMTTNAGNAAFVSAFSENFVAELFITQTATEEDNAWGVSGYPTFTANGVAQLDRPNGSVNVTSEKAKVKAAVDAHIAAPVVANTGFTTAVSGDQFVIETKTNFFAEGNGDYFVAVYVLEDGIVGKQSGHPQTPNVTHHHVLRGAATLSGRASAKTFGEKIASGTVAAGTSVYKKFIFDVGEGHNTSNYEVVTVIWKKNGTKYAFVNANSNQ